MHAEHPGGHGRRDTLVVVLDEARALDPSVLGAKAANLARLAAADFPVPLGFVVTPAAIRGRGRARRRAVRGPLLRHLRGPR